MQGTDRALAKALPILDEALRRVVGVRGRVAGRGHHRRVAQGALRGGAADAGSVSGRGRPPRERGTAARIDHVGFGGRFIWHVVGCADTYDSRRASVWKPMPWFSRS